MKILLNLLEFLTPYGSYSYGIMFFILVACGFGFPMPEDVILVTGGVLSARGIADYWLVNIACFLGVILGDGIVFAIGRKGGPKVKESKFFRKIFTPDREKIISSWFQRFGEYVIFFARFVPGLRMPIFLSAGIFQVSYWKFFLLDGFAAIISVPAWIWVGHYFGGKLEILEEKISQIESGLYTFLVGFLVLIFAGYYLKRKFYK